MFEDLLINVRVNQDGVRDGINGVSNAMRGLGNTLGGLKKLMGVGSMYMLAGGMAKVIKSTLDMTETVNLFNVSMGDMAVATNDSLLDLSKLSGLDVTNLQDAVGMYSLLARSMGMSSVQSSQLSTNTTKLATDLSSLTNVPIQRVMQDLRSGLLGQSETVYKYGMDVTEAGLKTEAMNQGISKSVRDMSQGEKMALRYSTMIRQSGLAQGDFASTIEVPANQLRILSDRFVTLGRSIGSIFIPILGALLPYLNALVSILTDVANAIASFFGFKAPEVENTTKSAVGGIGDVTDGLDGATGSAGKTTKALKEMKKATMGFDELNILPDPKSDNDSNAGAGGGAGVGGNSILPTFEMPSYDSLTSGIKQVSDDIKNTILDVISAVDFQPLIDSLSGLWDSAQPILDTLTNALSWLWDEILVPLGQWTIEDALPAFFNLLAGALDVLSPILEAFSTTGQWLWDNFLAPIAEWTGGVIVDVLNGLADELSSIGDWMSDNMPVMENLALIITSIGVAIGIVKVAMGIHAAIMAIWGGVMWVATYGTTALGVAMLSVSWPIVLIIAAIAAVIAIVLLLIKNWDWVKEVAINVFTTIKEFIGNACASIGEFFSGLWDGIVFVFSVVGTFFTDAFTGAFNGVKKAFSSIGSFFSGIWNGIKSVFGGVADWFGGIFTKAWTAVKKVFSTGGKIFDGIKDGILNGLKSVINGLIGGINKIISIPFNGINWALGKIKNISILGNKPFGWIDTINVPSIPKLARGGMVDGGGMFQAGENGKAEMIGNYQGKTTVMPLENTSFVNSMANAVYGAVKSAIPSTKSDNNDYPSELILQVGSTEFGRVAINSINKITKQEGRLALNI